MHVIRVSCEVDIFKIAPVGQVRQLGTKKIVGFLSISFEFEQEGVFCSLVVSRVLQ